MKMTIVISKFLLVKSSETNFIFLPVFPLIMCLMKAPKNPGKIVILKKMRAGFLRRCQNSLWQTSPEMMHFQA